MSNATGDTQSFEDVLHTRVNLLAARTHACDTEEVPEHVNDAYEILLAAHTAALRAELELLEAWHRDNHAQNCLCVHNIRRRIAALTNPQEGR